MVELEFSSKDLARIKYHVDRSLSDNKINYEDRYTKLLKDLKMIGLTIDEENNETHEKVMDEQDEKLRWKLELIQEAKHAQELEEEEDDE